MQDNDLAVADRQGPQGDLDGEGVPQRDSADPRLGNVIAAQAGPARRGARERLLDKVLGLVEIAGHQRELADQPAEARGVEALELRVHVPRCPVHAGAPSGSAPPTSPGPTDGADAAPRPAARPSATAVCQQLRQAVGLMPLRRQDAPPCPRARAHHLNSIEVIQPGTTWPYAPGQQQHHLDGNLAVFYRPFSPQGAHVAGPGNPGWSSCQKG